MEDHRCCKKLGCPAQWQSSHLEKPMHSFKAPSGITYHHNGDFSGSVEIPFEEISEFALYNDAEGIEIPFGDIRTIYLESLRQKLIAELEQADYDTLEKMIHER